MKFCLQFLVASYYGVSLRYLVPGDNLIELIRPFYNPFHNQSDHSVKAFYKYITDNRNLLNPNYKSQSTHNDSSTFSSTPNDSSTFTVPKGSHVLQINIDRVVLNELDILHNLENTTDIRIWKQNIPQLKKINLNTKVIYDVLTANSHYCKIISFMAYLILQFSDHVTKSPIFMLPQHSNTTTSLTKIQCAVIIGMAFFNMLPNYAHYFSFDYIKQRSPTKIKAIMNYYIGIERMYGNDRNHLFDLDVRYCRNQGSSDIINRIKNNKSYVNIKYTIDGSRYIEEFVGAPQAVFAN